MKIPEEKLVNCMAEAMARMEGYYLPRSIAARHNNPGNLRSWGKRPVEKGFAVFPTADEGFAALKSQIRRNIGRKLTFFEFFAGQRDAENKVLPGGYSGYAPAADKNNPRKYAQHVVNAVKKAFPEVSLTPDTQIISLL